MKIARVRRENGSVQLGIVDTSQRLVRLVANDGLLEIVTLLRSAAEPGHGEVVGMDQISFLPPIERPPSVRDFMIFEDHVANARNRSGRDVPKAWYDAPAFYFANPSAIVGPDADVDRPRNCRALDFELEVACVIGAEVSDLQPDDPRCLDAIAGFMLFNDWSARDLQVREATVGLGPVKGKDFCTSVGPWIITPDELGKPHNGRWSCDLKATVNGRLVGGGNLVSAHFGWHEVVARASENTRLVPGDVLGSGTMGTGCLLELRELGERDANPWLQKGDVVELLGGPLGTLRNTVAG
jgi:2-keto-4-pentenoate hydratase/2-oxohepta-3-ene-1,7-dioic acid hydratase in catechol pathway